MKIRRILVALDASPHSLAALEAAAAIASSLEAELLGLFVEDINLLRVAELPFASEFGFPSAARRKLDRTGMERAMRIVAREAREAMALAAGRLPVRWSFRVARGPVLEELIAAAGDVDLLAIGKAGGMLGERLRLGSTALGIVEKGPRMVLLLQRGTGIRPPVAVVVRDGSDSARQAVEIAATLAGTCGDGLVVVIADGDPRSARNLQGEMEQFLRDREATARYCLPADGSLGDLVRVVRAEQAGIVVMPAAPGVDEEGFRLLVEAMECPVLLVR